MGRYIDWADAVARYREIGKEQGTDEISSTHIYYAEMDVDAHLGGHYAAPFSANNVTAKDLAIDFTYVRMMRRSNPKAAEAVYKELTDRIDRLRRGELGMITTSGDLMRPSLIGVDSTTKNYAPVFTMVDYEYAHVGSSQALTEFGTY